MNKKTRKIIHVDMDCFYAQVEMRDNPKLQNVPLAIGGKPGTRSVLCTSNYIARKFGVRSAMSSNTAVKLCPNLVILPPDFSKYKRESEIIQDIFYEYTDLVEPLSLDEAYIDVTNCKQCHGSATLIAREIKKKIFERTGLTASAGVAPNKFLAKVASEWKKPNGLFVITPDKIMDFVPSLPVKKINGVGPVTCARLKEFGIETCGDILKMGHRKMQLHLGQFGDTLWDYAHGIDEREVINDWTRKSLSCEETYISDIDSLDTCLLEVMPLLEEVTRRLMRFKAKNEAPLKIKKGFVKLKFHNFKSLTVEKTRQDDLFKNFWENGVISNEIIKYFHELLTEAYNRNPIPVRLIGLGVRFGEDEEQINESSTEEIVDLFSFDFPLEA